ncbi:hypothetical protein GW923_04925 [Candidatus Pacearchaeota archaeon]|nr:hypothetical protein [Candidatus Pacearchaeota archaeon]
MPIDTLDKKLDEIPLGELTDEINYRINFLEFFSGPEEVRVIADAILDAQMAYKKRTGDFYTRSRKIENVPASFQSA